MINNSSTKALSYLRNLISKINIFEIVLFGFFIRSFFLIVYPRMFFGDSGIYKDFGKELFSGNIMPSSVHMPGYPVYLYICNFIFQTEYGVVFVDIILSSISIYIIYLLTNKLFEDKNVSKISSIIFAIYPFSIFLSISTLSESLYVFLMLAAIYFLYINKSFLSYLFFVLSIYVKSISNYLAPIFIASFYLQKKEYKLFFKNIGLYLIIYSILFSPWWVHNFVKHDKFVFTDLTFSYHLYAGNNILNKTGGGIGGIDVDHSVILNKVDNDFAKADKIFKKEAYNFIINNPDDFLKLLLVKTKRFWSFTPYTYESFDKEAFPLYQEKTKFFYKIILFLSFGPIFIMTLHFFIFYSKKYIKNIIPIIIFILVFSFAHILTIVSLRYRFPLEPFLIIFSSFSIKQIIFRNKI